VVDAPDADSAELRYFMRGGDKLPSPPASTPAQAIPARRLTPVQPSGLFPE